MSSPREFEKPNIWPDCFLNNKWTPCPNKPVYHNRHTRAVPLDKRIINRHMFQLPLSLNLLKEFPHHVKQTIKRPVSIATGMFNPILGGQQNYGEWINHNNNLFNHYYNKPRISDYSYVAKNHKNTNFLPTDISHNIFPVTPDITDYYKHYLHSFHENSSGATNNITVTFPTFDQTSESISVSENPVKQTTNFETNSEKTTQNAIPAVNGKDDSTPYYGLITNNVEEITTPSATIDEPTSEQRKRIEFAVALDHLDRVFYTTTFNKLLSISSPERAENGISFVQSGLFLSLFLMTLSSATDAQTAAEIDTCIGINSTNEDKRDIINEIITTFPKPNDDLRWRWSSRLVLGPNSTDLMVNNSVAEALHLHLARCNESDPEKLANALNHMVRLPRLSKTCTTEYITVLTSWMPTINFYKAIQNSDPSRRRVSFTQLETLWEFLNKNRDIATGFNKTAQAREYSRRMWMEVADQLNSLGDGATKDWKGWCKVQEDSGGAIRDTFEPDELSEGFRAAAITMLYFRARWRSAPTVLNGTRPFRDEAGSPARSMRMIRINDMMRYAHMDDWGCQAIEISYATPGLTLLMLVPDGTSMKRLARQLDTTGVYEVARRLEPIRIAVSMPLYTLRMTLLLPAKLQSMGINRLVDWKTTDRDLKLSHAVQRIMFWAEPGRNAFKDDGIEWDLTPELELVVDRPYLFFVRWHNLTLMNGNFVL